MKLISIVTPCYNEQDNIMEIYQQIKSICSDYQEYEYEHVFIDNASTDNTVEILQALADTDKHVKVIINARNFGHIRSPFYGLLQARGDAVVLIAADMQDPPTLIRDFIRHWEIGAKVVVGVKPSSQEAFPMSLIRRTYYQLIAQIADLHMIKHFTGFGLYDRKVIAILQNIDDGYPYFRGLISEIGYPVIEVPFHQPVRQHGKTKNNLYTLYDMAILGITSHSKFPIRLATIAGFMLSIISLIIAFIFLGLKLLLWNHFPMGIAPILISMFFFASVQLFFIGILGEYILSIHRQVFRRPLVVERERINFELPEEESTR